MLPFLQEFIGHFHPVVVHLPIGILLLAVFFDWLSRKEKYRSIRPAVKISLLIGALGAIAAVISGYLLSGMNDYDASIVSKHQWLGIVTTVVSVAAYYAETRAYKHTQGIMVAMAGLVIITGHLGGSITHGDGYLTTAFTNYGAVQEIKPIANVQEAMIYQDIIEPTLATKCYSCHSGRKQKGGLRLDGVEWILKGGKNGAVVKPGDAGASELVHRTLLPREHEDHMPPKEKPQPAKTQIELLKWWVSVGAPADKRVKDLPQSNEVQSWLASLQAGGEKNELTFIPADAVEPAVESDLRALQSKGVVILPIAQNSNYLSANFINADTSDISTVLNLLLPIKKQLLWLKLGEFPVTNVDCQTISQLTPLSRLQLNNVRISDNGLIQLKSLVNLQYLNLSGTNVSASGLKQLKDLHQLKVIYLYDTRLTDQDCQELAMVFKRTILNRGSYQVPTLAGDTTEVTVSPDK